MDQYIRLNTIFVPSEELAQKVLQMASKISNDDIFHIDNRNYFAHLTIYSPEFPINNREAVLEEVRNFASQGLPVELEFEGYHSGWGYVGIEFKKTQLIADFHRAVVEKLNLFRNGHIREKYAKEITDGKYTAEQVRFIQKYGYHNVFTNYHPHLTLARYKNEEIAGQIVKGLNPMKISSSVCDSLAVCEMGENGTCTKIIDSFKIED